MQPPRNLFCSLAVAFAIQMTWEPVCTMAAVSDAQPPRRPNLLLIFSDDHGWSDLGAQRADKDIQTPNLDQLARDGVRFTRGYVTAPQCVPSRAGVITGRYQQRFGVEDNGKGPLPLAETTIAERLKEAGYVTGHIGKWHLDLVGEKGQPKTLRSNRDFYPHAQGFDEYWRGELRQYVASHDLRGQPFADAPHLVSDERFRVVVQTDAAISFLDRRAARPEQPWFLYLAWFAPHVPLDSPEPWFSRTPAHLPKERRQALSMIAAMDDGLGRIRAKLRAMGAETNTLIFFIGDNGAPLGRAWNGSLNVPMVGQKGMLSEGGIRVPFVGAWPGRIPAGQVFEHPVISLDVAATGVALAGLPHDPRLDGVNLLPHLTGASKAAPHDVLYWRWGSQAAVLEFPWKLIRLGSRERLLFDITQPDGENLSHNLVRQKPELAARLEARLKAWSDTLQPPGLPASFDPHHEGLFGEHGVIAKPATNAAARTVAPGTIQGWVCRNGTLTIKDGAMVISPATNAVAGARLFFTHSGLDIQGPVAITLRLRAKQGGASAMTWRTKQQPDFLPANSLAFDWPTAAEWQEVKVELPVAGRLIHLRINTAKAADGLEVQSIVMRGKSGQPQEWKFQEQQP